MTVLAGGDDRRRRAGRLDPLAADEHGPAVVHGVAVEDAGRPEHEAPRRGGLTRA